MSTCPNLICVYRCHRDNLYKCKEKAYTNTKGETYYGYCEEDCEDFDNYDFEEFAPEFEDKYEYEEYYR